MDRALWTLTLSEELVAKCLADRSSHYLTKNLEITKVRGALPHQKALG